MEFIHSKVDDRLLHIINRLAEIDNRTDIVPPNNFLQCASLRLPANKTAHKHIKKERTYKDQIAQESWVVIKGRVRCYLYDIDDTLLATPIIGPGDASFTLEGGHTYEILEHDSVIYEMKTGPYEGQELDKIFID